MRDKYSGDDIVVGLSGGADSVALLFVLREAGARVFAAHVNHGLRGEESERDEAFVRDLCAREGIELRVFRASFDKFSEEEGRIARYRFFEQARLDFNARKIAVGHNADDNAETVLMNLCRGAGLRGLGGIPPISGAIIRPLLEVSRAEIEAFLHERGIEFLVDSTNSSNDFARNRVRNKIIPALEAEINSGARAAIARAAGILRGDCDFIEGVAREAYAECMAGGGMSPRTGDSPLCLCADKLAVLHDAIAARVVRRAIAEARRQDLTDISQVHVAAVMELARGGSGREVHLPGCVVVWQYGVLIFYAAENAAAENAGFCYEITSGVCVFVPEIGKEFTLLHGHPYPEPLFLRTRRPGDKITFKNADGKFFTKKLQDYFTDEKIPRRKRDEIPLLAHGGEVFWIFAGKGRGDARFEGGGFVVS